MSWWRALRSLLATLAIVGLIAGPIALPQAKAASSPMSEMMGEMPCCPDAGADLCTQKCPFLLVCAGVTLPAGRAASAATLDYRSLALAILDDRDVAGRGVDPPRKPPRN